MYAQLKTIPNSGSGADRRICTLPSGWRALGITEFQATNTVLNESVSGMITSDNMVVLKAVPATWSEAYLRINFSYFCEK